MGLFSYLTGIELKNLLHPQPVFIWTIIEAIGTLAAAVIAAFGWLYFEIYLPRKKQPKLKINFDDAPPYRIPADLLEALQIPPITMAGHFMRTFYVCLRQFEILSDPVQRRVV